MPSKHNHEPQALTTKRSCFADPNVRECLCRGDKSKNKHNTPLFENRTGGSMNIGDLVISEISGKTGIVVGYIEPIPCGYCYVLFQDSTYSIHTSKLKPLEEK